MGLGVYLYLIDKNKYDSEVVPAFEKFYKDQDSSEILFLIEEVLETAEQTSNTEIYKEMYMLGKQILSDDSYSYEEKKNFMKDFDSMLAVEYCKDKRFKVINFAKTNLSRHLADKSKLFMMLVVGDSSDFSSESLKYLGEFNGTFSKKGEKLFLKELNLISVPRDQAYVEEFNLLKSIAKESIENENLKILCVVK